MRSNNPLRVVFFVAVLSVIEDVLNILSTHRPNAVVAVRIALCIIFIPTFIATARLAWLAATGVLVGVPATYLLLNALSITAPVKHLPPNWLLWTLLLIGALYSIYLQKRYRSFWKESLHEGRS